MSGRRPFGCHKRLTCIGLLFAKLFQCGPRRCYSHAHSEMGGKKQGYWYLNKFIYFVAITYPHISQCDFSRTRNRKQRTVEIAQVNL